MDKKTWLKSKGPFSSTMKTVHHFQSNEDQKHDLIEKIHIETNSSMSKTLNKVKFNNKK